MRNNSPFPQIRTWLGLERNILVMLGTLVLLGMGEELWVRFVPKYIEALGGSVWVIAAYGTLKDLLDGLYQYPGGWLTDRLGRRHSLMLFSLLAIAGYLLYLIGNSWEWVMIGTCFVMAWGSLSSPAMFAIIGDNLPQTKRAIGFGVQAILKRVPIVLAPPIGGLLIATLGLQTGIKTGLLITVLLALTAIVFVRRGYVENPRTETDGNRLRDIWQSMDNRLMRLLVADCLARWAEGIPKVFIVLYVINILREGAFEFGWLTSIEMITAMVVYIPIAKLADRMNRKPFVLLTFSFFALFPFALALASSTGLLVIAFAIAGLREIGEPARKSLIVDLASETARGRVVGLYYLMRGLAVFPASIAGGWLWTVQPEYPFYAAFVIGSLGVLWYALWTPKEGSNVGVIV